MAGILIVEGAQILWSYQISVLISLQVGNTEQFISPFRVSALSSPKMGGGNKLTPKRICVRIELSGMM